MNRSVVSRRTVLSSGAAVSLGALTAGHAWRAFGRTATAPLATPDPTSDQVLASLLTGNERFAAGKAIAPNRDAYRVAATAPLQAPVAAVLGCADSRVPVEVIFDQGIGDLFVARVAGNISTPEVIASLEYGTAVLGAKVLVVLGHTRCGAVAEAARGAPEPGHIDSLFRYIHPAIGAANGDAARAIAENVKNQTSRLTSESSLLARLVTKGDLKIVGGIYDVATGRVAMLAGHNPSAH